jgi:hypothetical protein
MGVWRTIYGLLNWEYYGAMEQGQIDKHHRLKFLLCKQIKNGVPTLRTSGLTSGLTPGLTSGRKGKKRRRG